MIETKNCNWSVVFMFLFQIHMFSCGNIEFCEDSKKLNDTKFKLSYYCDYTIKNDTTDGIQDLRNETCCLVDPQDCERWLFSGNGDSSQLAEVKLNAFGENLNDRDIPLLNVSISNINFTNMKYRIQGKNFPEHVFCREINLHSKANISDLFYDSFWIGFLKTGQDFEIDFEAQNEFHKASWRYMFKMHTYRKIEFDISDWFPFIYIDITNSHYVTARWQQAPSLLSKQNYKIEVCEGDELEHSEIVLGTNDSNEELHLEYSFGLFPRNGLYRFQVQVPNELCKCEGCYCADDSCVISESPVINIGNLARKILIGSLLGIFFAVMLMVLVVYLWRIKHQPYFDIAKLPKVLMLYSPSSPSHIQSVTALAEYLRKNCYVVALLDVLDIPRTATKDPYMWYNDAFLNADYIMVISSPPKCCNKGIYKNADVLALNFITELLQRHYRPQIFNVILDYCDVKHIPDKTKNFRVYNLTKDLDSMLLFIHSNGKFSAFNNFIYLILKPKIYGGKSDLKSRKGAGLLSALKAAEDPRENTCNCNGVSDGNIQSVLFRLPEVEFEMEGANIEHSNYTDPVSDELSKCFIDLSNLNLSGETDILNCEEREPNFLDFIIRNAESCKNSKQS